MPASANDRLDSWKEIAAFLRRSVRTARRWEHDEGLPVHRHVHRVLGSVYAYKSEIDTWRQVARRRPAVAIAAAARSTDPAVGGVVSIAVLPFANLSADPENAYLADGFTDEVTADLSRIGTLRVISRRSALTFKQTTKHVSTIARELGVQYVLEGSVRRVADRLRVTARLLDAKTDAHLWADKYDGSVEDVFAIQERLARVIVNALALRLTAVEDQRLAARPIDNVHAYECYLRARQEAWRWRRDAIEHAIQLLRNGLAIVGDNARLYAALGHANLQLREAGIDVGEAPIDEAELCARKAMALEPDSASARQLRGWIHYSRGRIQEAVRNLKAAVAIEPYSSDTLLLLANCYLISGRVQAARPLIDRALAVDPLTPVCRCMPAFADILEGHVGAAVGPYRQMCEMDPSNPMARLFYVWVLVLTRRVEIVHRVVNEFPRDVCETVPARLARFLMHAAAGHQQEAAAEADTIEERATAADVFPRMLAQGYALADMPDRAVRWLTIAVERGFINYPYLSQHDPIFASLHRLPPFQQLLKTVRRRWKGFDA